MHPLDIGLPKAPLIIGGVLVNEFDLVAAVVAGSLVAALALLFQRTAIGRALRAVADDHQAAQSVGIPLNTIWVIVWSVAGVVGLVAGIMWGSNLGVQFSLSLVALKALPVLMLGGFTSVPGAIVGGLIIGVGEKIAEVFWGPLVGGGDPGLVRLRPGARLPAVPAAGPVRRAHHRAGVRITALPKMMRVAPQSLRVQRSNLAPVNCIPTRLLRRSAPRNDGYFKGER